MYSYSSLSRKCNDYRLILPWEGFKCYDSQLPMAQGFYSTFSLALCYIVDTGGDISHADQLEQSWDWGANPMLLIEAKKNCCVIENNLKPTEACVRKPGGGFNPYAQD